MKVSQLHGRKRLIPLALVAGVAGTLAIARTTIGSDHMDTPLTELNPQLDLNDVWAFPGSTDQRIVLALTIASPTNALGRNVNGFDPNALYQIKVDNNQDGVADRVLQFSFDMLANGNMTVDVMGPAAPRRSTLTDGTFRDLFLTGTPTISRGALNTNLTGAATGADQIQVFAGMRDDPFYIDLEQFFRIVPDRRPTQGPLSRIGQPGAPAGNYFTTASAFRAACQRDASGNITQPVTFLNQPGPFDTTRGCASDFLRGANALAIIVELPEAMITRAGGDGQIGVWGTISK